MGPMWMSSSRKGHTIDAVLDFWEPAKFHGWLHTFAAQLSKDITKLCLMYDHAFLDLWFWLLLGITGAGSASRGQGEGVTSIINTYILKHVILYYASGNTMKSRGFIIAYLEV